MTQQDTERKAPTPLYVFDMANGKTYMSQDVMAVPMLNPAGTRILTNTYRLKQASVHDTSAVHQGCQEWNRDSGERRDFEATLRAFHEHDLKFGAVFKVVSLGLETVVADYVVR
ncbi:TPA: hypothetical protein HA251_08550 [Candidatus Woesearchaeota archaeon]|nr:hypothetical protein [Candidatus Woesearchaeota archaeon]